MKKRRYFMELTDKILTEVITPRPQESESHKGTFGRVVLIGGNAQYGGAIMMSALAAVSSGAGLTTVLTDSKNHTPLHTLLPEAMVLDWHATEEIMDVLDSADVLLIGPGMGTSQESRELLKTILAKQKPEQWLVVDGSALTLLAKANIKLSYPEKTVLTPHQMEWQRLSKIPVAQQKPEQNKAVQKKIGATVVLKSHRTTIYGQQEIYENTVGSPAMATGGMGDTLAGIITGFLAQFPKTDQTIAAAVYLHSLIGDELAKENYVVLPTAISAELPRYMKRFCAKNEQK
ncbi:YjeF domain protein [Enterococcus faecalis 13-SD-W-01]|nr:YjeF domain protein [Enterococcus faecalis 13-SD-W-01]